MKDIENVPKQTYKKNHLKENNGIFIQIFHRRRKNTKNGKKIKLVYEKL